MAFLRFCPSASRHAHSGVEVGLFQIAYSIVGTATRPVNATSKPSGNNSIGSPSIFPARARFNRSRSKGYYRRTTKGISWFKDTAAECLAKDVHTGSELLRSMATLCSVISEDRIGYIVYEDEVQVVAEPLLLTRAPASSAAQLHQRPIHCR